MNNLHKRLLKKSDELKQQMTEEERENFNQERQQYTSMYREPPNMKESDKLKIAKVHAATIFWSVVVICLSLILIIK